MGKESTTGKTDKTDTDKITFEEQYKILAQDFDLPKYKEMSDEYEIDTIDAETKHIVREVAKKVFERIDNFKKILETLMHGDAGLIAMQEAEFFSEEEHEQIMSLTRKLMRLDRALLVAELENTDAAYAGFIKEAYSAWPQLKKELAPIAKKMHDGWQRPDTKKRKHNYLG